MMMMILVNKCSVLKIVVVIIISVIVTASDNSDDDDDDDDDDGGLTVMYKVLKLSLSSSLSYTCSIIAPILTHLFHADPLHPRGG